MILVCNDIHLGTTRKSGTTPQSQQALSDYLHESFFNLIMQYRDDHLVINGDLFDGFTVDSRDLIRCYNTLHEWLSVSRMPLTLIAGNHDHSAKGDKVSGFQLLCHFLSAQWGRNVNIIDHQAGFSKVADNVYAIPHMLNQDLFDIELEKAAKSDACGYLLLHCNVMSTFAEQSDHSLNITSDQVRKFENKFRLVFGHEHQHRDLSIGGVLCQIVGNQFPGSIIDCLPHGDGQRDGKKFALRITEDLGNNTIATWSRDGDYAEIEWDHLVETQARFVRIVGTAALDQAADVVNAISRFRQRSPAFIVANAVQIEGLPDMEALASLSAENVKSFDVLQALLEILSEEEGEVVKGVLNAD